MNKISKTKKQQIVLVFVGVIVLATALWYLVLQNEYGRLELVRKKTSDMEDKVTKAEKLLKRAGEIEGILETETKLLETSEDAMASGDIYLWFINTMNRFNTGRQVTLSDFQRESLGQVGALPKFPYSAAIFPVKGTAFYHTLGKFLADFENSFPYARVQNLELSPSAKSSGEEAEQLNFKFEIVALIKPLKQ